MKMFRKEVDYYLNNYNKISRSKLQEDRTWAKIIDEIRKKYAGTPYGELIRLKYEMKQKESVICKMLHIESTTYYAWSNKIINEVTLKAAYEHLIVPF